MPAYITDTPMLKTRSRTIATRTRFALACVALLSGVAPLAAQSAQPLSVQMAALVTTVRPGGRTITGVGIAPQLGFNRLLSSESLGAISVGIGAQYSYHTSANDRLQVAGVFVEPRWALPFSAACAHPYLSGRAAAMRVIANFARVPDGSSNGFAIGAGPGVNFRMTSTANLDVGIQAMRQSFGSIGATRFRPVTTYAAKVGVSFGLPH